MINDQLQTVATSLQSPWAIVIAGGIIDLAMRVFKTKEPKSLMYVIAAGFKLLANIFTSLGSLMDNVIQRTDDTSVKIDEKK